jgi:protein-S-isoprenylcysteine O-methyltransferase Ste14
MNAHESMIKQGNWLFKYRSYLPIVLLAFVLVSMWFQRNSYQSVNLIFDMCCFIVSLCGESIRVLAVGYAADSTSGRNTKQQVAAEINQTGIYSLLRHPLYVGNFFMWFGIALFVQICWILPVFVFIYWLYYERIILAEENYLTLKFGDAYASYAARTSCILPLNFKSYLPDKYVFRIRKVLRQENSSLYGVIIVFVLYDVIRNFFGTGNFKIDKGWLITGSIGTAMYLIIRTIKKQTKLLGNDPMRIKTK